MLVGTMLRMPDLLANVTVSVSSHNIDEVRSYSKLNVLLIVGLLR